MKEPVFQILMSFHPEYAEKILSGEKTWEFRKKARRRKGTIFIYETKPIGKIVGKVDIDNVEGCTFENFEIFWKKVKDGAGIEKEKLREYFAGRYMYAYKLKNPVSFKKPLELADFGVKAAPQSFRYLNDGKSVWEETEK